MPAAYSKEKIEQKLLSNRSIDPITGCWNWTGSLSAKENGCGRIFFEFRRRKVYRLAMWLWRDFDLDSELCVCHRCDNPKCFNPEHLFIGTRKDNSDDMISKGRERHVGTKGSEHWNYKYDLQIRIQIKDLYNSGRFTQQELAEIYETKQQTISNLYNKEF